MEGRNPQLSLQGKQFFRLCPFQGRPRVCAADFPNFNKA